MKFTIAITALISIFPGAALGVPCELCPNFDANLPIDMSLFDTMMSNEGANGQIRRNFRMLQGDDDQLDLTSCAQLPAAIELMGPDINATTCVWFELMAALFCGCEGACSTCPDGSAYPDLDAIPDYEALGEMDTGSGMGMGQPGTCRELVTQMGAMTVFFSFFDAFGGSMDDAATMAPSELDVDVTAMLCGVAGMACGCPLSGCPLCNFGLDNPEMVVDYEGDSFTCAQGIEQLQMMGPMGMCSEAKIIFDETGCLCKEAETETETDEVVDDNTNITVEISNATEAPSETPDETSTETSDAGPISLSLSTVTMLLTVFSWFFFA
mmetsp:Transcript_36913/g.42523  ORF Transcript_36913/g.42523 Transcript_36913/m.42523 type:complete len:325 (-) Transcript_36913:95-1069(-)